MGSCVHSSVIAHILQLLPAHTFISPSLLTRVVRDKQRKVQPTDCVDYGHFYVQSLQTPSTTRLNSMKESTGHALCPLSRSGVDQAQTGSGFCRFVVAELQYLQCASTAGNKSLMHYGTLNPYTCTTGSTQALIGQRPRLVNKSITPSFQGNIVLPPSPAARALSGARAHKYDIST